MAIFLIHWPCLLTTKISYMQKNKSGHANQGWDSSKQWWPMYPKKYAKVDEIIFFMKDWNDAEGWKITVVLIQNLISCQPKSKYQVRRGLPNYFKKQSFLSSFLFTQDKIQIQNCNGVLNRLVLCLKCMELAC